MATRAKAVFLTAELTMVGERRLALAPLYPEIRWIGEDQRAVSSRFETQADRAWSRRGELLPWLEATRPTDVIADRLTVVFPATTKPLQPELDLAFDVLIADTVGWVPALGIAAWATDPEHVRDALIANIQLEFARNKRLKRGSDVLRTQWFTGLSHRVAPVAATFYTFNEIRAFAEERKRALLPQMATRTTGDTRRCYEVDALIERIERTVAGGATNLLLVGASGVGKSTVLNGWFAGQSRPVWETTASQMERALTEGSGWQENLDTVIRELRESGDVLFVRNLAELFEVGRYVGNQTSMAEYLRTALQNAELRLVTECTPEQRARIDARYPGFLSLFHEVVVPEPEPDAMDRILARTAEVLGRGRLPAETARRVLALQRRFTPYSGFPGKTVRFLEHLVRAEEGTLDAGRAIARFCAESGLPRMMIDPDVPLSVAAIRTHFDERIVGQPAAVDAVVDTLVSVKTQTTRRGKPIASLLFAGPTGVGKTETAKALAAFLFGGADRMIRFDMSEFSSPGAVLRLAGAGEGLLTSAVRRTPFCVLLFDEIEKADSSFFDLLLQVLGEGRLTDGRGRLTDFCSAVVVMTSNLGADRANRSRPGFSQGPDPQEMQQAYKDAITGWFRPELVNRIDRILPFSALPGDAIRTILDLRLAGLAKRTGLVDRTVTLALSEPVRDHLATVATHPAYGARQLNRELSDRVLAPVANVLNEDPDPRPLTVGFGIEDGALVPEPVFHDPAPDVRARFDGIASLADATTDTRRTSWAVRHGAGFAQLQSELHILERRKTRLGKAFWKRTDDVARHGRLTELFADLEDNFAAIDALEEQVALDALVDRSEEVEAHTDAHRQRVAEARELYRRLYTFLADDDAPVVLGVYGDLEPARTEAARYERVAVALDLEVVRYEPVLWRSPDEVDRVLLEPPEEPGWTEVRALGVELWIGTPGPMLAFDNQEGLIRIAGPGPDLTLRVVVRPAADIDAYARPENIHRRAFYDNQTVFRIHGNGLARWEGRSGPLDRLDQDLEWVLTGEYWDRLTSELKD